MPTVFMDINLTNFQACQFKEALFLLIFLCGSDDIKIKAWMRNNDHILHIPEFSLVRASYKWSSRSDGL